MRYHLVEKKKNVFANCSFLFVRNTDAESFAALALAFTSIFVVRVAISVECNASACFLFSINVSRLLRGERKAMLTICNRAYNLLEISRICMHDYAQDVNVWPNYCTFHRCKICTLV